MKNYKDSDYAVNKFSEGIVYRFSDCVFEVTIEEYLRVNPDKTAEDFAELKALSDEIYYEQVKDENAQTKKNISIHGMEETDKLATESLDIEVIQANDKKIAIEAARELLKSGLLTEVQERRFVAHFFKNQSIRQIAKQEGVFFTSVAESLNAATSKLKKYFKEF